LISSKFAVSMKNFMINFPLIMYENSILKTQWKALFLSLCFCEKVLLKEGEYINADVSPLSFSYV
jgi:hypothetical protein